MKAILTALAVLIMAGVGVAAGEPRTAADALQLDQLYLRDFTSQRFLNLPDRAAKGIWICARITPKSIRSIPDDVEPDSYDQAKYEYKFFSAQTLHVLTGAFPFDDRKFVFAAYSPQTMWPFSPRSNLIPPALELREGIAMFHVVEPQGSGTRSGIEEAFCVPEGWEEKTTAFIQASGKQSAAPFAPIDPDHLREWDAVVHGDDPFLGIIAMARLCESGRLGPRVLIEGYVAHAQGVRQAAYTRLVLRHAETKDVRELATSFQRIIATAKDFDAVRGLALGLLTADGHRARAIITKLRLGSGDMTDLDALPVADRICEPVMEKFWLRFRYLARGEPYYDVLRKLADEPVQPDRYR